MANICSVDFNLVFKTPEANQMFIDEFSNKIAIAESKHEGVKIAEDKWLFDASVEGCGESSAVIYGSVKWALEHESIRRFTEYLESMQVLSFECNYEETGCLIYGKYSYENGELSDCYVEESHPAWELIMNGEDDYFDELDDALETDSASVMVA